MESSQAIQNSAHVIDVHIEHADSTTLKLPIELPIFDLYEEGLTASFHLYVLKGAIIFSLFPLHLLEGHFFVCSSFAKGSVSIAPYSP